MRLLHVILVASILGWSTSAWATPITVTFAGTIASAAPLWSYWLPGFGIGDEISGSISGDTEYFNSEGFPSPAFWTFNVAGHTGTANATGATWVRPTGVSMNANWNASISGSTEFVASYIAEMFLDPENQTGRIFYSGIGRDPNGVTQWDQTWEANITQVAVNLPEPSTLWLAGIGLVVVAFRRQWP